MSIFLLRNPDCILIHIPKTGGSSIRHGLWGSRYEGPAFGEIPSTWPNLFTFAFVRHPLDRFVSAYADFTQLRGYSGSIEDFANIAMDDDIPAGHERSNRKERIRHHTIPQTHPLNSLNMADEVFRFEDYSASVATILCRVGKEDDKPNLPQRRKTSHGTWQEHLGPELRDKLVEFFATDFEALGYTVD